MMASFFLSKHGLKPNDVAYIGVGAGQGAITALRTGQIDAIANLDPVISTLVKADELKVIADTRPLKDTHEIFGGDMPSGRSEENTSELTSLMRISYAVI